MRSACFLASVALVVTACDYRALAVLDDSNTSGLDGGIDQDADAGVEGPGTLAVMLAGQGSGAVSSSPAGIACTGSADASCSATFAAGTAVMLTANAGANSTFSSWSGACLGSSTTCATTVQGAQAATATFALQSELLSVTAIGSGAVTSSPGTIDCGSACSSSFEYGTSVTLTAAPMTGWQLASWSGACSGTAATCSVAMTAAKSATAEFTQLDDDLSVVVSGSGAGTITGGPIDCGTGHSACSANETYGTSVTLTAAPAPGSTFVGWSSPCSGTGTCTLTVDSATTVTATFALVQETLTVELQGSPGTVAGAPFTCTSSQCTASVPYGTTVTLTATPPPASIFRGWSGGGCTGSGTCTLTLDSPITVDAEFAAAEALTVTTTGNGAGNVSGPSINCGEGGTICSANEPVGTSVMLLAAPGPGSTFTGWSSTPSECPHGGSAACSFTIEQATSVSATFVGTVELTVAVVGDGTVTGKVSTDEIIDCGESQTKCSASEPSGTTVVLTPGENGMWTIGPCAGSSGTCTFVLDADTNVTAAF